jgi:4-hydroxybenzoate polyprenyltransferase
VLFVFFVANQMRRLILLIQVSRPIVWPVLPLVYGLGMNAANAAISIVAVIQMVLLTFPMNLIGCGLNDIYDYESDRRSARRRAVWGAVIEPDDRSFVFQSCVAMMPLVVLSACLTRNWDNYIATVSLLLVAWLYSVPPARLKERPPLDSVANGLGYFLLPFMMGYSLGADQSAMPLRYYLLALCVCGIHALATAADYDADRAAGHRTLAVVFGRRAAAAIAFAAFFITWLFADFHGVAVRAYIATAAIMAGMTAVWPQDRTITLACVTIFIGFIVAAICHIAGV